MSESPGQEARGMWQSLDLVRGRLLVTARSWLKARWNRPPQQRWSKRGHNAPRVDLERPEALKNAQACNPARTLRWSIRGLIEGLGLNACFRDFCRVP